MRIWLPLAVVLGLLVAPAADAKAKRTVRRAKPKAAAARKARPQQRLVAAPRAEKDRLEAIYRKYEQLLARRQSYQDAARNEAMASLSQYYQTLGNGQITQLPGGRPTESVWKLQYR